jgi:Family of unknown function (DUF6636)
VAPQDGSLRPLPALLLGSVATRTVCTCRNDDANEAADDEKECRDSMKATMITAGAMAIAAAAIALPVTAHADPAGSFQSPSGNIVCLMGADAVRCQVQQHTYAVPPPGSCHLGGWGSQFALKPGDPPYLECVGGVLAVPPMPTLDYGQTRSVGAITCDSEPSGVTCTDAGTGHFFRVSRDSYQLS